MGIKRFLLLVLILISMQALVSCSKDKSHTWIFSGESKTCTHIFKADGQAYSMEELQLLYPACTSTLNTEHHVMVLDCTKASIGSIYVFTETKETCESFRTKYDELKK